MTVAVKQPRSDERPHLDVYIWRRDVLTAAGVAYAVAVHLAAAPYADLHVMLEAKRAGCSDDQLRRIFL